MYRTVASKQNVTRTVKSKTSNCGGCIQGLCFGLSGSARRGSDWAAARTFWRSTNWEWQWDWGENQKYHGYVSTFGRWWVFCFLTEQAASVHCADFRHIFIWSFLIQFRIILGFVLQCLQSYGYSTADVINAILENNLPPHLAEIPFDSIRIPPEPEPEQPVLAYRGKMQRCHCLTDLQH